MVPCLLPHSTYAGARFFDKSDAMQKIGNKRVAPYAASAQLRGRQTRGQASRADDLDSVGVDFDEDICALDEPVPMHRRVGDGLSQGAHRVFGYLFTLECLDSIGRSGVPLNEAQAFLDIRYHTSGEILTL